MNEEQMIKLLDEVWKEIRYFNEVKTIKGIKLFREIYTNDILNVIRRLGAITEVHGHCDELDDAKRKCYELIGI